LQNLVSPYLKILNAFDYAKDLTIAKCVLVFHQFVPAPLRQAFVVAFRMRGCGGSISPRICLCFCSCLWVVKRRYA